MLAAQCCQLFCNKTKDDDEQTNVSNKARLISLPHQLPAAALSVCWKGDQHLAWLIHHCCCLCCCLAVCCLHLLPPRPLPCARPLKLLTWLLPLSPQPPPGLDQHPVVGPCLSAPLRASAAAASTGSAQCWHIPAAPTAGSRTHRSISQHRFRPTQTPHNLGSTSHMLGPQTQAAAAGNANSMLPAQHGKEGVQQSSMSCKTCHLCASIAHTHTPCWGGVGHQGTVLAPAQTPCHPGQSLACHAVE